MTRQYARIANRVVADEYDAVTAKVEALYQRRYPPTPKAANMRRLRAEVHHRLLGNGWCPRPVELDCSFESICETCAHFATGPEFVPVLLRQRNHARDHDQPDRADLFDNLLHQPRRIPLTPITRITPRGGAPNAREEQALGWVGHRWQFTSSHRHHDLSLGTAGFDVGDGLVGRRERKRPRRGWDE